MRKTVCVCISVCSVLFCFIVFYCVFFCLCIDIGCGGVPCPLHASSWWTRGKIEDKKTGNSQRRTGNSVSRFCFLLLVSFFWGTLGNRDGASYIQFYNRLKGETPTYMVVENMDGEVFGGFAASPWVSSSKVKNLLHWGVSYVTCYDTYCSDTST